MKLVKTFEKYRKHQLQVLEVSCTVNSRDDIDDLQYSDYEANLYINHRFVSDISFVMDDAGLFTDLIDKIDWHELYSEKVASLKHAI